MPAVSRTRRTKEATLTQPVGALDSNPYRFKKHLWHTFDELGFLAKLGTLSQTTTPRRVLLERYLEAMPRRQEWGDIDALKVRAKVVQLLTEERVLSPKTKKDAYA